MKRNLEMAHHLGLLAALGEDPGLVSSFTHMVAHTLCNLEGSSPFFWPPQSVFIHGAHTYIHTSKMLIHTK